MTNRFALQVAVFIASTVAGALLAGCTISDASPSDQQTKYGATCGSVSQRAQSADRPFTSLLAEQCKAAIDALSQGHSTISAWYANKYLETLENMEGEISRLEHAPGVSGEYLIAKVMGVTDALGEWTVASKHDALRIKAVASRHP